MKSNRLWIIAIIVIVVYIVSKVIGDDEVKGNTTRPVSEISATSSLHHQLSFTKKVIRVGYAIDPGPGEEPFDFNNYTGSAINDLQGTVDGNTDKVIKIKSTQYAEIEVQYNGPIKLNKSTWWCYGDKGDGHPLIGMTNTSHVDDHRAIALINPVFFSSTGITKVVFSYELDDGSRWKKTWYLQPE